MADSRFVLNKHKGKLHNCSCKYATESKNLVPWEGTPEEAVKEGYTVCKECISVEEMNVSGIEAVSVPINGKRGMAAANLFGGQMIQSSAVTSGEVLSPRLDINESLGDRTNNEYRTDSKIVHREIYQDGLDGKEPFNIKQAEDFCPSADSEFAEGDKQDKENEKIGQSIEVYDKEGAISQEEVVTKCVYCGADILPDAVFCLKCGKKVKIKSEKKKKFASPKKTDAEGEMDRVNEDGYYSPALPVQRDEVYGISILETIFKIGGAAAGIFILVLLAMYYI